MNVLGISANDVEDDDCTAAELASDLLKAGFSLGQLSLAGFTAIDLKRTGCTAGELKRVKFHAAELREAGFDIEHLVLAGFPASELKLAGCTAADLKALNFGATKLKRAGFNLEELRVANFTAADLKDAGCTAAELRRLHFCAVELRNAHFNAVDLKKGGYTAAELLDAKFSIQELRAAGYGPTTFKEAGVTVEMLQDLIGNGIVGFHVTGLAGEGTIGNGFYHFAGWRDDDRAYYVKADGHVVIYCYDPAGVSRWCIATCTKAAGDEVLASIAAEAREPPEGLWQAKHIGDGSNRCARIEPVHCFTIAELSGNAFMRSQIKLISKNLSKEMHVVFKLVLYTFEGFSAKQLRSSGIPVTKLVAVFNISQLKAAGVTASDLKEAGCTALQLKAGTFTVADIVQAGFDCSS